MLLKSLEILGFKSFAERTKFVFDGGITGIVGPNGCGKSNVVDSIRWVLGEQKTRNLRSDKMENIIFNGTQKKRKGNFAEVSLTFENTKNLLPTEYTTVTITRKLYRSGESEYQINGVSCRLKDIQNLFMDTGVSSDSYAIIELKMVDEILTNKDNERRKFFEEAAGISKYKIRKRQTLKKLQDTDADLDRVEDLLFEIEKNLKTLEKQARRTQKYFEIKEQYRLTSSQYAYLTMGTIREKQKQIEILSQNLSDQLVAHQSSLAQQEARMLDLKKIQLDHEDRLGSAREQLHQHTRKIQSVETQKSIKNERLKFLRQREVSLQDQLQTEQKQKSENEAKQAELSSRMNMERESLTKYEREEGSLKEQMEQARKVFEEQKTLFQSLQEQVNSLTSEVQQHNRDKEIKLVQLESLKGELQRAEEDRNQRSEDLDAFTEKSQSLNEITGSLEKQVQELRNKSEAHQASIEDTEQLLTQAKDQVYKSNRLLDAKQNEFNLTKSLVENLEGFPESVKFLKKNAQWIKNAPLLSDIFSCPEEYKVALENYLDTYLSYYIVPTRKDAALAVHLLADAAKGRANFFVLEELDNYKASTPILFTQAKAAMDVVDVAQPYKKLASFLLDNVYLVPEEKLIPDDIEEGTIFLTQTGNLSRRKYIMSGGSLGLFEGKRLGRAKNLDKLDKEIGKLQKKLGDEKSALEQFQQKLNDLKKVSYRKELDELSQQLQEKQRDLSVLQSREKEYREFISRVGQRSDALINQQQELEKELEAIHPLIRQKEEELLQSRSSFETRRQEMETAQDSMEALSQTYNQAHITLIQQQNQFQALSNEHQLVDSQIQRYLDNQTKLNADLKQVAVDMDEIINSNKEDDDNIIHMYDQKKNMESTVGVIEEQVAQTRNSLVEVEENLTKVRRNREEVLERQRELESNQTEIKLEFNSLRERMRVEFDIDISKLREEDLFEDFPENYNQSKIEQTVQDLRAKVQRFGEINPMAVEAFNEMKERFDFINGQKEDLLEAKESLLTTIAEIDQTAKEKFLETYHTVRDNFQRVFRSLFMEEDKCDLVLLDPENPLESEINIIAQPKGKRPLTIKQLSGGEKTLTAVALLFAIYLIKPAPFCVFDEVDAPLDDANIDKFNNIIRDFAQMSQFIIVTHNKRTMAQTNTIYGVTMEERGISRVLPIDLEDLPTDVAEVA